MGELNVKIKGSTYPVQSTSNGIRAIKVKTTVDGKELVEPVYSDSVSVSVIDPMDSEDISIDSWDFSLGPVWEGGVDVPYIDIVGKQSFSANATVYCTSEDNTMQHEVYMVAYITDEENWSSYESNHLVLDATEGGTLNITTQSFDVSFDVSTISIEFELVVDSWQKDEYYPLP